MRKGTIFSAFGFGEWNTSSNSADGGEFEWKIESQTRMFHKWDANIICSIFAFSFLVFDVLKGVC